MCLAAAMVARLQHFISFPPCLLYVNTFHSTPEREDIEGRTRGRRARRKRESRQWDDVDSVVFVFVCERERERERYILRVSADAHCCQLNYFLSFLFAESFKNKTWTAERCRKIKYKKGWYHHHHCHHHKSCNFLCPRYLLLYSVQYVGPLLLCH